ncbi:MAG: sigma 54 modulation/S30EA ribosomal C-terminal domain-containing protein, partial [Pseudorhodobacter sp.]|nr:sigma 54 modulation/S30EA ribosomal C-terminal domain-containing protein [Pseudorhodobacter sp.]
GEAVMQLELGGQRMVVFRNEGHGGVNVVYRRDDGNIGWIDPRNSK